MDFFGNHVGSQYFSMFYRTIATPVQGDMAVIENTFVEGKTSRTAYFYNGANWAAFDGNYRADNV